MKLSRTGWNNVIIFSVMGFILLINATNQRLFPSKQLSSDTEVQLLTETQLILSMTVNFDDTDLVTIERIAQTWRATPTKIQGQGLDEMMRSWQSATGEQMPNIPIVLPEDAIYVTLMIAGRMSAFKLVLYSSQEQLIVHDLQNDTWLSLPAQMVEQLLPSVLFTQLEMSH